MGDIRKKHEYIILLTLTRVFSLQWVCWGTEESRGSNQRVRREEENTGKQV